MVITDKIMVLINYMCFVGGIEVKCKFVNDNVRVLQIRCYRLYNVWSLQIRQCMVITI